MTSKKTSHKQAVVSVKKQLKSRRPVHKKLLLHPLSVVALFVVGIVLVASTLTASAATFNVTATVEATPPTDPAIITSPTDGSTVTDSYVNVSGTCPDQTYVELTQNGTLAGESNCVSNGFTIGINLTVGANLLQAQDYSVTNQPGPVSTPITVYYQPVITPPPSSTTPTSSSSGATTYTKTYTKPSPSSTTASVFRISFTDFRYQVFSAGQTASFNLMLDNGKAPYGLTIVWGDGDISTLAITSNGGLTISHTYNSGSDSSGFIIKIDASDSAGTTSSVQLSALVRSKSQLVALTTTTQSPVSRILSDIKKDAVIIWPTYLVSVVAVFSFWLGEMKELHEIVVLKKNPGKLRYRH